MSGPVTEPLVFRDTLAHVTPQRTIRGDVVVAAGVVTHVGPSERSVPPDAAVIDASGTSTVPLLVDSAVRARPARDRGIDDLMPGNPATFAVIRGVVSESRIRQALVVDPRDLLAVVLGDHIEVWNGGPTRSPGDPGPAWIAVWTDTVRDMKQYLTPQGRYSETRQGRSNAYTGRYWVHGDRITYLDDQGFWAFGQQVDGVLHHAGFVLRRAHALDARNENVQRAGSHDPASRPR